MVSEDVLIGRLGDRVRLLNSHAKLLAENPSIGRIAERLAIAQVLLGGESQAERPAIVALLGGTGVGKSRLFSSLVGQADASPSSAAERGFTKTPVVALAPNNKPFVESLLGLSPTLINPPELIRRPLILIDTPDIDSILVENQEMARRIIELSDVVLYVADPERYNDRKTLREVLHWANRKVWMFVFNKADQTGEEIDRLRLAFDNSLKTLGFEPSDSTRFFVSAEKPAQFEFQRLHDVLFRFQLRDVVAAQRLNQIGSVKYALDPDLLSQVEQLDARLDQESRRISEDVLKTLRRHLQAPQARREIAWLLSRRLWAELPGRIGGPILLAVWLRARVSGFSSFLTLGRFLSRSMGLISLLAVGVAWAFETVRNRAALVRILNLAGPEYRVSMNNHKQNATWSLEEVGLATVAREPDSIPEPKQAEQDRSEIPWWAKWIAEPALRSLRKLGKSIGWEELDNEVAIQLDHDLDRILGGQLQAVTRWYWRILANTLPAIAIGHIAWRVVAAWIQSDYLPLEFYGMALLVFVLSCLPGYVLVTFLARSTLAGADELISSDMHGASWATLSIDAVRRQVSDFLRSARHVRGSAAKMQETISQERVTGFAIQLRDVNLSDSD